MSAAPRSIGSLETWEPSDKSFSKHILEEGRDGSQPNDGSLCTVILTLINPEKLEDSDLGGYKFGPEVEVTIGEGDTVMSEFLDKVVCSMKEGELCYVKSKIDSRGKKVSEFDVNANMALKFNAHLKVMNRAADVEELEPDECIERAQHHKDKGTELFKLNSVDFATKRYIKALSCLRAIETSVVLVESLSQQYKTLMCHCYINLAACYLKEEKYKMVIENCTKALEIEANNVKAWFRRGQAYSKLCEYKLAKDNYQQARELEPENKAVLNKIQEIDGLIRKEREMYKKMLS